MIKGVWESVRLGPCIHTKGWGLIRGTNKWFFKIGKGISGWFTVCMGDGVEDRFMVAHDKANGQWEL